MSKKTSKNSKAASKSSKKKQEEEEFLKNIPKIEQFLRNFVDDSEKENSNQQSKKESPIKLCKSPVKKQMSKQGDEVNNNNNNNKNNGKSSVNNKEIMKTKGKDSVFEYKPLKKKMSGSKSKDKKIITDEFVGEEDLDYLDELEEMEKDSKKTRGKFKGKSKKKAGKKSQKAKGKYEKEYDSLSEGSDFEDLNINDKNYFKKKREKLRKRKEKKFEISEEIDAEIKKLESEEEDEISNYYNLRRKNKGKNAENVFEDIIDYIPEPTETKEKPKKIQRKKCELEEKSTGSNIIEEGVLSGLTIVITGLMEIDRPELTKIIKNLGARVTGSVSGRTDILLHGEVLEDGRKFTEGNKYKTAVKKGTKIMDAEEFQRFVREKSGDKEWSFERKVGEIVWGFRGKSRENEEEMDVIMEENNATNPNSLLWVDKYRPRNLDELIGNISVIQKLIEWLDDWNDVNLQGKVKKTQVKFRAGKRPEIENLNARACLITGDPGIGKTTAVRLIAQLKGYSIIETNASDKRNKSSIDNLLRSLSDNLTLHQGELKEKTLILLDEIDGMAGNEDRGGVATVISIIKETKTPIVCIANDRQSQKLKTLVNYCYDLKFIKPNKSAVTSRLVSILERENVRCEKNAVEFLVENLGNDIRQCMNFLEIYTKTHKTVKFSYLSGKELGKDESVMLSNFAAASKLLNSTSAKLSFKELLNLYFVDYNLIPLLIHENYLSSFKEPSQNFRFRPKKIGSKTGDNQSLLSSLSEAADELSYSDIIDSKIRSGMDWRLLPERGLLGCCTICKLCKGTVYFPKFPEIMGKMSSLGKNKRELEELKLNFKGTSDEIRHMILPCFYLEIVSLLVDGDMEEVVKILNSRKMTLDTFKENVLDLISEKFAGLFKNIGVAAKSSLTRFYNKKTGNSMVRIVSSKKKKRGEKGSKMMISELIYDENGNPIKSGFGEGDSGKESEREKSEGEESGEEVKILSKRIKDDRNNVGNRDKNMGKVKSKNMTNVSGVELKEGKSTNKKSLVSNVNIINLNINNITAEEMNGRSNKTRKSEVKIAKSPLKKQEKPQKKQTKLSKVKQRQPVVKTIKKGHELNIDSDDDSSKGIDRSESLEVSQRSSKKNSKRSKRHDKNSKNKRRKNKDEYEDSFIDDDSF